MNKSELKSTYFEWMTRLVFDDSHINGLNYSKLLSYLHSIEFTYVIERDENRAQDGIDLRYKFGYEHELDITTVEDYLDNQPCSVLEMMVALANRCEETIMDNPKLGRRQGRWFIEMLRSLGLANMTNYAWFGEEYVDKVVDVFLNRRYKPNGEGGLFTISNCQTDLRNVEIWYQMCWYIDEVIDNEEEGGVVYGI